MPIALFCYNFPHRKTQEFLFNLYISGYPVKLVLAANKVKLGIPNSSVRLKIRDGGLIEPSIICKRFGWNYQVIQHDSEDITKLIQGSRAKLGVIAGARILKASVIDLFEYGIINIHPGLLPEIRGLDSLLWAVHHDVALGVTSHIIDKNIDAGRILVKKRIEIFEDDTVFDLSNRLLHTQTEILGASINAANRKEYIQSIDISTSTYHSKMEATLELQTMKKISTYIKKYSDLQHD